MSIFKISLEQQRLNSILEENGGEVTPELEEALSINEDNFHKKLEDYTFTILKYKAEEETIKAEIQRLEKLKKTAQKTQEKLKQRVEAAMIYFEKDKIKFDSFSLSLRKSASVSILDDSLINEKYLIVKKEVSKSLIKEDLKNGLKVEGAELIENLNLNIR